MSTQWLGSRMVQVVVGSAIGIGRGAPEHISDASVGTTSSSKVTEVSRGSPVGTSRAGTGMRTMARGCSTGSRPLRMMGSMLRSATPTTIGREVARMPPREVG